MRILRPLHVFVVAVMLALPMLAPTLSRAQLVGVDFNTAGSAAPQNWNSLTTAGSVPNLMNDTGAFTGWSFAVTTVGGGFTFANDPNPATVPTHTYSLANIDDYLTGGGDVTGVSRFSNLPPLTQFNVYAFGLRAFSPINMNWTVAGANSITFSQIGGASELWVNGELGSSSRTLSSYARVVTSSSSGFIDFTYDPNGGAGVPYSVAGFAIEIVPEPMSLAAILSIGLLFLRRRRTAAGC
jgi:hypothetical protein